MRIVLVLFLCLSLVGCASVLAPKMGMTEKQWLHRTLIGDLVVADDTWRVWKSGNTFYYFKDGELDHIDQGQLMQERFQVEVIHK